jgi:hypothetical protein
MLPDKNRLPVAVLQINPVHVLAKQLSPVVQHPTTVVDPDVDVYKINLTRK